MKTWKEFSTFLQQESAQATTGRVALRRKWQSLRNLADSYLNKVPADEIVKLLGKSAQDLDPELNDLKAFCAYCIGKGLIAEPTALAIALEQDMASEPLAFLGDLSGKTFGETWAPRIAEYWLKEPSDRWEKKSPRDFYDFGWWPHDLHNTEIKVELKASSEAPDFRFQQIRHPKLNTASAYHILLCMGVTAGSLEWWVLPTDFLDTIADNGTNQKQGVLISHHHGKRQDIWNDKVGYESEGWFVANRQARSVLTKFNSNSEQLRKNILQTYQQWFR